MGHWHEVKTFRITCDKCGYSIEKTATHKPSLPNGWKIETTCYSDCSYSTNETVLCYNCNSDNFKRVKGE